MRNLRSSFLSKVVALTIAWAAIAAPSGPLQAAVVNVAGVEVSPANVTPISNVVTATGQEVALYIQYVGNSTPSATTTVAVSAAGDLTFVYNGAAYTGFECPVSGALGGVIDVSDAACDTFGEVVDVINSDKNPGVFRAVIAAGLRADSSNDTLATLSASTDVLKPTGLGLLWDNATLDDINVGLWDTNKGSQNWFNGKSLSGNPWADQDYVLLYAHVNVTNAGTIGNYEIHAVKENYVSGGKSSEVDRVAYLEAGAATTVTGKIDEFINAGGLRGKGEKVFLRALASGADTSAVTAFVTGYKQDRQ